MSGSGAQKRSQALAVRVSILAETMTHRAIAEMVGKRPEQIKGLVELGQRIRESRMANAWEPSDIGDCR